MPYFEKSFRTAVSQRVVFQSSFELLSKRSNSKTRNEYLIIKMRPSASQGAVLEGYWRIGENRFGGHGMPLNLVTAYCLLLVFFL